jgi:hypothetical protein
MAWSAPFGGTVLDVLLVGSNVYVAGFGTRLAAYDQETAAARPAPAVNGEVQALAYDGSLIYVAGFYQNIGGQPRNSLAAFTPGSTTVTSWNPPVPEFRRFQALAVTGSYVYAADVGKVYTLAKSTGAIQSFTTSQTNGTIFDMAALTDRIIFVGSWHDINAVAQSTVAEFLGTP